MTLWKRFGVPPSVGARVQPPEGGTLPHHWWGARNWKKLAALDAWVLGVLEKLRELILALQAELVARVKDQVLPKGLGELTVVTLDGEVCDWSRFYNRKQVGSYTGCCPGEHSSGGKRRVGGIDRMGNGRVRALLVEAVSPVAAVIQVRHSGR